MRGLLVPANTELMNMPVLPPLSKIFREQKSAGWAFADSERGAKRTSKLDDVIGHIKVE